MPDLASGLSPRFFADPSLVQAYSDYRPQPARPTAIGDQLIVTNPYTQSTDNSQPLLNDTIKEQLSKADGLTFSTPQENSTKGVKADYKLTVDTDGQLKLEKVGNEDPLKDGKLNIEIDSQNKDVIEAIRQADKNLKEYIREMMSYWRQSHPGKQFPDWWQAILDSQPDIPAQAKPVPIQQGQPESQPQRRQPAQQSEQQPVSQSQSQSQPRATAPSSGASSGSAGRFGGPGSGGGDGQGYGYNPGGKFRGGGDNSTTASSGATPNADQQTVLNNVRTVVEAAKEEGVDPKLAVAMMLVESGGDNRAVGDNGTSFGLFQLHKGGMLTSAGLTPEQAYDPHTNAHVSLSNLAKIDDRYSNPGQAAAASQRPADPVGYAQKINASMDEAAELIAMAQQTPDTNVAIGNSPDVREADGYAFPVAGYDKSSVQLHWGQNAGGTDIFAERGTPVVAARGGTVTSAGLSEVGGYNVTISQDNGLIAYYAHMDQPPLVKAGQQVETGQQVGVVGDSGNAKGTGTHLHFGMGTDIVSGTGPQGGTGANFDAVTLLNKVLKDTNNA